MKVIYNNIIPFKGFLAINLFGILFVRSKYRGLSPYVLNHEAIHTEQMKELGYVGFYIIYLLEWIYRLVFHTKTAYKGISFEREAYDNESNLDYLGKRKKFAQWRKKY